MSRTFLVIAVIGLMGLFTSARYSTPVDTRIGYQAPNLTVKDNLGSLELQKFRGQTVVVTFWSSTDARSRMANIDYDRQAAAGKQFTHISVNMDPSRGVYDQIITLDGVNMDTQFHCSALEQLTLTKTWRLTDGFHSFLIDREGKIIAVDPDPHDIAA